MASHEDSIDDIFWHDGQRQWLLNGWVWVRIKHYDQMIVNATSQAVIALYMQLTLVVVSNWCDDQRASYNGRKSRCNLYQTM